MAAPIRASAGRRAPSRSNAPRWSSAAAGAQLPDADHLALPLRLGLGPLRRSAAQAQKQPGSATAAAAAGTGAGGSPASGAVTVVNNGAASDFYRRRDLAAREYSNQTVSMRNDLSRRRWHRRPWRYDPRRHRQPAHRRQQRQRCSIIGRRPRQTVADPAGTGRHDPRRRRQCQRSAASPALHDNRRQRQYASIDADRAAISRSSAAVQAIRRSGGGAGDYDPRAHPESAPALFRSAPGGLIPGQQGDPLGRRR